MNSPLRKACQNGQLQVVRYLLTGKDLLEHADIHDDDNLALRTACANGQLNIVQYLLTSPELKDREYFQHHPEKGWGFHVTKGVAAITGGLSEAAAAGHLKIVQYILEDENLLHKPHIHDNDNDYDVLFYACMNNHEDVALYLARFYSHEELKKTFLKEEWVSLLSCDPIKQKIEAIIQRERLSEELNVEERPGLQKSRRI